jgi:hypothetical protein
MYYLGIYLEGLTKTANSLGRSGVPAEIRTEHLLMTSLELYLYTDIVSVHCRTGSGSASGALSELITGGICIKIQNGRKQVLRRLLKKYYMIMCRLQ